MICCYTPSKQMHMRKLEEFESLVEEWIENSPRKCQQQNYNIWVTPSLSKRVCVKPLHSRLEE